MKRRPIRTRSFIRTPAYREAFERLDQALEQNTDASNAQKIELLGRRMFGDEWDDPAQTHPGVGPE